MGEEEGEECGQPQKKVKTEPLVRALTFNLKATCGFGRSGTVLLPHGNAPTPVFMPVGTKGTIKGLTSLQMKHLDCRILLSNTYHLNYKPGKDYLREIGGLHKFMSWDRNILTDSGGFQMVSLSKLSQITEEGVSFTSPYDKSVMFIRPEDSIGIQNCIGSDIMMALDDVVKTTTVGPRMEEAMERTIRWIGRNITANKNPSRQSLFPIVQGGVDQGLRKRCLQGLLKVDADGFAIGGLAGGQLKSDFFKTVRLCCEILPADRPRYLMGVGYPVDILLCSALGVDMFDCVFPTRTARFGTAFTSKGEIKLRNKEYKTDFSPLDDKCKCSTCTTYTRAYLHFIEKEDNFCHLLSVHNIAFNFKIMTDMQRAIENGSVNVYVQDILNGLYSRVGKVPMWVKTGLQYAGLDVKLIHPYEE